MEAKGANSGDTIVFNVKTYDWCPNHHGWGMWVCHKPDKLNVKENQVDTNSSEEEKDNGKDI